MAGYSGKPLATKLGLKPGMTAFAINAPENYNALLVLPDVPVEPVTQVPDGADFIHVFSTSRAELMTHLRRARDVMARDGMVWASWPKKAARVPTDVTEDTIREDALPLGLVDVKVCAVDDTWSGLKLVIRKTLR